MEAHRAERDAEAKREAQRDQAEAAAKREHELKMAQMKLDKTEQRRDDKLQAERQNNQCMLAQTAQTAASKQAPVINNASQQGGVRLPKGARKSCVFW